MKLIALDMDGTLLNHHHTVSPANVQAIRQAQSNGIHVVIATGRSYQEAQPLIKEAGLSCPLLCVNGADIRTADGERINQFPLSLAHYQQIVTVLNKRSLYFEVYSEEGTLTEDREKAVSFLKAYFAGTHLEQDADHLHTLAEERFTTGAVRFIESYDQYFFEHQTPIYKIMGYSLNPSDLAKTKEELQQIPGLAVSSSAPINLEVNSVHAQKGNAVQAYANSQGISLSDVMAIGDSFNDLSMMRMVGMPVAMGNAEEEVKAICRFTTKTNEEDGVAFAIERELAKMGVG